ncbi:MAG: H-NS histone family protein [Acetobacteraceae bacterium]|nr:H-NS histone family protein [Acetobacteraceae bacterium]
MSDTETVQPRDIKRKHTFDLDNMGVEELTALRDAAEAKRRQLLDQTKTQVVREFREKLRTLGLTLADVLPSPARQKGGQEPEERKKRRDAGEPLPVKYRGPNSETWSGRGREPRWLQALQAEGRKREEFRVSE